MAAADELEYFQATTGIQDVDLCTEILSAHGWDLELAISAFTGANSVQPFFSGATDSTTSVNLELQDSGIVLPLNGNNGSPSLAWTIVSLPFSAISGAVGFGMWATGGMLSYSLLRTPGGSGTTPLVSVAQPAAEAMEFVSGFEGDYGRTRPNFRAEGFMDALQRSRREYKLLFVYLQSPDHPDTPDFCERALCNEMLTDFLNEKFVSWGASVKASEGFKMSNSLKASRFPFCAVVMAAANQRIALLQQVEGPKSPEEIVMVLQRVLEESAPVLDSGRLEAEERRNREEQDAAYEAALEAGERQRQEEAERKRKQEEEDREREAKMREQKASTPGAEPDVTQALVPFPSGDRKGGRFDCTNTVQSLYNYVDSLEHFHRNTRFNFHCNTRFNFH